MRHVRDMHLQLVIAVGQHRHVHGVVEIARGFAVDGNNRQRTKILAPGKVGFRDPLGRSVRLGHHFIGERMRNLVLADDDLDVDADVPGPPENFDHFPGGREASLGIARDLHVHHGAVELGQPHPSNCRGIATRSSAKVLAQCGRELFARWNSDFLVQTNVVGQHHVAVRAVAKQSNDCRMLPLGNLHDSPFGTAVRPAAQDSSKHAVAVHGVADIVLADEEVAVDARNGLVGHHETIAVAMRYDAAGNQIGIACAPRLFSSRGPGPISLRWRGFRRLARLRVFLDWQCGAHGFRGFRSG